MDAEIRRLDAVVRHMLSEDLPMQLASFHSALNGNDFPRAASEVHAVYGAAAFCKLEALRHSAAELEQSLKQKTKNAALIRAFENEANAVLQLLHQHST